MAAITISKFRLVTGASEATLSLDAAVQAVLMATSMANRLTGRYFGHAIESVAQDGSDVLLTVYGHGQQGTATVLILGTGVAELTGEVECTVVDAHTLRVAGVTSDYIEGRGMIAMPMIRQSQVIQNMAIVAPGPVAMVKEVRARVAQVGSDGPFPLTSVMQTSDWYCDTRSPNLRGELEIYASTEVYRRVRGLINPVLQKVLRELEVTYYAGFASGMPDDLAGAIAAFAQVIASDPSGLFQSENFEDYSYQKMDPAMMRAMPTSAMSVILGYRMAM